MKQVQFADKVTIQEYSLAIGDNPACSSGVPVQLGWEVREKTTRNFGLYEFLRQPDRRRGRRQLAIPADTRAALLLSEGYSYDDISRATKEARKTKKLRDETLQKEGWDRLSIMALNKLGWLPANTMLTRPRIQSRKGVSTGSCDPSVGIKRLMRAASFRMKTEPSSGKSSNSMWKFTFQSQRSIFVPEPVTNSARTA